MPTSTTTELADPRELRDPLALQDPLELTPSEQREFTRLSHQKDFSTLEKVALGLGAAFLLHRAIMSRRIKEKAGSEPRISSMRLTAEAAYQLLLPRWLGITVPALVAGYLIGVKEAKAGQIPEEDLYQIAEAYARDLGKHYNEVSTEAMLQGFQAQVNRKVPPARAARMAAEAFGVPPRAMNALVSIWNTEDPKVLSSMPVESIRDIRAKTFIDAQLRNRAGQIGEAEAWSTKSQAKQIVWAYGVERGIIPEDARRVWVTAKDEKVCKHCGPLHRQRVEVGQTFDTTLGKAWTPPLHVNCRCDVVLEFTSAPKLAVAKRLRKHTRESFAEKYGPGVHQVPTRHLVKLQDGQPRKPERVKAVQDSIKEEGIKTPLAVNRFETGAYLMNGHHRLQAARNLKIRKVPVEVKDGPYQVSKARPGDPYDRDKSGRFSRAESRPASRPYATPTERLHDQVNVPSLEEDLTRQLKELEQQQLKEAQPKKITPKQLGQKSLTSRTLGQKQLSDKRVGATPRKLGEGKQLGKPQFSSRKLSGGQQRQMREYVYALSNYAREVAPTEDVPFGWEPAEFPIAYIIDPWDAKTSTFVLGHDQYGVRLGTEFGEHGGHQALAERLDQYWDEAKGEVFEMFMEDSYRGELGFSEGDMFYDVDIDTLVAAIEETVYGTGYRDSESVVLEDMDGNSKAFKVYDIARNLGVDVAVEDFKPTIAITSHMRVDKTHEHRGKGWINPGKFMPDSYAKAVMTPELYSNLPARALYVKPIDD